MTPEKSLSDPTLTPGASLLSEGRALAADWTLGTSEFMRSESVACEADYKRRAMGEGRIMQHAHIGFRSVERTVSAVASLHDSAARKGARIDRFGVTLDWSMGYPPDWRDSGVRGTGIVLREPEDFARITNASPAAAHFGDFMLGLPGALHNTKAAIAGGATAIGNLGQYFTFRLPYWNNDVATTEATVRALGLIAAQPVEILVHSNLDDGFAGLFRDMTSALGMMLIEKHIIEDLIGARAAFCFGHHFSAPLTRAAFQRAMAQITDTPGSMIFGNTVSYRSDPAANFASLSSYLLADLMALARNPTGHAINPVPVTENLRIPDVDEILDAQLFAARLRDMTPGFQQVLNVAAIDAMADRLLVGALGFSRRAMTGLEARGVDIRDPAALMLAIRRLGAKQMELLFGQPDVSADWVIELDHMAVGWVTASQGGLPDLSSVRVALGTTDVHEHGAYLVRQALEGVGVRVHDAGVSIDAETLVESAVQARADAIAISTYNGVGLGYVRRVMAALAAADLDMPVMIGGKLNEVPTDSNSDLPVDVTRDIGATGAVPCADLDDMLPVLRALAARRESGSKGK